MRTKLKKSDVVKELAANVAHMLKYEFDMDEVAEFLIAAIYDKLSDAQILAEYQTSHEDVVHGHIDWEE